MTNYFTRRLTVGLVVMLALAALALTVSAQDAMQPSVTVSDQVVIDSSVTIDMVYSAGPGFIVIHIDNGEGRPGPVIGYRQLSIGANYNVKVWIDAAQATNTLFAMLHEDTGELGVYEFGTVEGADGPVRVNDQVITPPFAVEVMNVKDQLIENDTYTAASVTVSAPGWLVIHIEQDGRPGPVAGQTLLEAGTTANVAVALDMSMVTPVLWPMLHVDTGEAGVYEFGTVEGADAPVRVNNVVATAPIWTVPHVRVADQIVTYGDGMESMMAPTVMARSVLAAEPGWLVIHNETDGGPGPVAGYAQVPAGLTENLVIELDPAVVTPNLWPMLHVDTGEAGVYEFGTVEGADGPVRVNDQVLTFQIAASPSIDYTLAMHEDGVLEVASALIDAPGWLVIHIEQDGRPGPVAGQVQLTPGWNEHIHVTVDVSMLTENLWPMLHYDTGEAGVYEFGTVDGADLPVSVGGNVVTAAAQIMDE